MVMNNLLSQSVKIPHRSSHYLGHHFLLTTNVGTITPILCHPLIPGSEVNLSVLCSASLAPLASDVYLRAGLRLEAFFCPMRFLYLGYENWLSRECIYPLSSSQYHQRIGVRIPTLQLTGTNFENYCKRGSLADYLGVRCNNAQDDEIVSTDSIRLNYFPFAAYHYIVDTWYNNSSVQLGYFRKPSANPFNASGVPFTPYMPYVVIPGQSSSDFSTFAITPTQDFFLLRQRNFPIDYFTSAMVSPQFGDAESVSVDTSGGDSKVSIAALRAANSLQVWRERIGLSGVRFNDYLRSQFGTEISDSNGRRPMFLGSGSIDVYSKGVEMNTNDTNASIATNNPFQSVGARYGNANANGQIHFCGGKADRFIANEPGYLMVMATLVPKVSYSSGIERYMLHYTRNGCEVDLANPILQNVGNQEIKAAELFVGDAVEPRGGGDTQNINRVFGYQQRYAEYMYRTDRIAGLYRDGGSLESFVAQRNVGPEASMSTGFLQIPVDYLDQVSAVSNQVSQFGCMIDSYIDLSVAQPLYESSVPSLVNPSEEHGRSVVVMRGGKRIV